LGVAAETLTIRLEPRVRAILAAEAKSNGTGLSTLIRQLAEAEATRLFREEIRREGERVVQYLATHPEARAELEMYDTTIDWPEY